MSAGATIRSGAPAGIGERPDPAARLEALCDPGSFRALRTGVRSSRAGERALPGDGVLAGAGTAAGRPIFCFAEDPGFMGGSLGEAHAQTIVRVMGLAGQTRRRAGGRVRRVRGGAAAGGRRSASTRTRASSSRTSPVRPSCRRSRRHRDRGRRRVLLAGADRLHRDDARRDHVPHRSAGGAGGARRGRRARRAGRGPRARAQRRLPRRRRRRGRGDHGRPGAPGPPPVAPEAPPAAAGRRPGAGGRRSVRPARPTPRLRHPRRGRARSWTADGSLEIAPGWATQPRHRVRPARRRSVGVVANQPRSLGGILDAEAARKGAAFVDACTAFGVPLVVLVDTPGFMPGRRQENQRHHPPRRRPGPRVRRVAGAARR